ncbi:MAG TPA: gamma-glutamylcyclotransferase family protein [Opitutus sp.]|nr:gamma-glutamylcyclotransferase family protein [Opitutus sp.]
MTAPASTLVFVYGTLKRSGSNHHVLAGQVFVGDARTVPGYALYDLGAYPGMVRSADDRDGVAGEVWSVDPAALARLDAFEGVPEKLYRRDGVPLLAPFADRSIDAYFYLRTVDGRRSIAGGNWSVA